MNARELLEMNESGHLSIEAKLEVLNRFLLERANQVGFTIAPIKITGAGTEAEQLEAIFDQLNGIFDRASVNSPELPG